jgi:putative transposase
MRQYTTEQQQAVLADVPTVGVVEAARKHNMPSACVSRWARAASVTRLTSAKPATASATTETPSASRTPTPSTSENLATTTTSVSQPTTRQKRRLAVAKSYTPSQRAVILEDAAKDGPAAASKKHGVSRFSIRAWQRKVTRAAAGQGPSPTSGTAPKDIAQRRDAEILAEWKTHPGLGPSQIVNQLRRKNVKVSVHTTRRVMEDAGYRPPKVVRQIHDRRYEAVRPNQLWHLDFVQRFIGSATTFTLILIDDFSRYVTGSGVDDAERADMVIRTFEEATTRHGRPENVMHDKGSAFWSWKGISRFTALLTEMGIDPVVAEHKEWNGKVEVFNANLHKELFDSYRFYDVAEMHRRLQTHLHWYNHTRTHHALGGLLVPADRYYGRAAEVLARIEAGAGRDLGDGVELRDRCLELFKVISRGGVPEVWLLGQKLLGPQT